MNHCKNIRCYPSNKDYEISVYIFSSSYSSDCELLTVISVKVKNILDKYNRVVSSAKHTVEEQVRNIGLFGITVENPEGIFTFYPPHRIFKVEYNELK